MKLSLLTHYGNEYLCPLTLIKVFGSTMMEDLQQQEEEEIDECSTGKVCANLSSSELSRHAEQKSRNAFGFKNGASSKHDLAFHDIRRFQNEYPFPSSKVYKENQLFGNLRSIWDTVKDENLKPEDALQSQGNQPGNQENVFKAIMKRLRVLEKNMTTTLAFIEGQTTLLDSILKNYDDRLLNQVIILKQTWNMTVDGFVGEIVSINIVV